MIISLRSTVTLTIFDVRREQSQVAGLITGTSVKWLMTAVKRRTKRRMVT